MDNPSKHKQSASFRDRLPWQPPALKAVGALSEVLQHGNKISINVGDPGETIGKPPGQG